MLQAGLWSGFKSFKHKGIKHSYYLSIRISTLTNMYLVGVQITPPNKHVIKSRIIEFNWFKNHNHCCIRTGTSRSMKSHRHHPVEGTPSVSLSATRSGVLLIVGALGLLGFCLLRVHFF